MARNRALSVNLVQDDGTGGKGRSDNGIISRKCFGVWVELQGGEAPWRQQAKYIYPRQPLRENVKTTWPTPVILPATLCNVENDRKVAESYAKGLSAVRAANVESRSLRKEHQREITATANCLDKIFKILPSRLRIALARATVTATVAYESEGGGRRAIFQTLKFNKTPPPFPRSCCWMRVRLSSAGTAPHLRCALAINAGITLIRSISGSASPVESFCLSLEVVG
ncbi:hypothetical protein V1478_007189 [Vespula squamosa]|uniref:Uncharacterized protein n=1 Tax=Vespula squamosa TaxID=30214 RepID=A0ABD2B2G6_VESSQ